VAPDGLAYTTVALVRALAASRSELEAAGWSESQEANRFVAAAMVEETEAEAGLGRVDAAGAEDGGWAEDADENEDGRGRDGGFGSGEEEFRAQRVLEALTAECSLATELAVLDRIEMALETVRALPKVNRAERGLGPLGELWRLLRIRYWLGLWASGPQNASQQLSGVHRMKSTAPVLRARL
jgi:hypothetical protein